MEGRVFTCSFCACRFASLYLPTCDGQPLEPATFASPSPKRQKLDGAHHCPPHAPPRNIVHSQLGAFTQQKVAPTHTKEAMHLSRQLPDRVIEEVDHCQRLNR